MAIKNINVYFSVDCSQLLDITEQPIGSKEAKRRKKQAGQEKKCSTRCLTVFFKMSLVI
jgi:hypothetical protein